MKFQQCRATIQVEYIRQIRYLSLFYCRVELSVGEKSSPHHKCEHHQCLQQVDERSAREELVLEEIEDSRYQHYLQLWISKI